MLRLYNTLTRKKEVFKPLKGGEARLYTCGPTVYDFAHIGNFRAYTFEDLLRRYLKFKGFKVRQVMNITDVDDKTIKGSQQQNTPLKEFTAKYEAAFFQDLDALNIERAELYPRATEHIKEMAALIKKLLKKGFAYRGGDASIYFSVPKFKGYGRLSKFKLKKLKLGIRVQQDEYAKNQAADFALWKAHTEKDGGVFWETELGKGRPGWHIECSAMSMKYLGESFDIHTGGIDNMFPHHENEIAQSEAATGKRFVNFWLHCAHLIVDGRKMSKSLGNFYTLRDLTSKGYSLKAVRLLLLSTHYRSELNLTEKSLKDAEKNIAGFKEFLERLQGVEGRAKGRDIGRLIVGAGKGFESAMDNDLDIRNALNAIFSFMHKINSLIDAKGLDKKSAEKVLRQMKEFDRVLGVMEFEEEKTDPQLAKDVEVMIAERGRLRAAKKWAEADKVREKLREKGIQLIDTEKGTKWKKI